MSNQRAVKSIGLPDGGRAPYELNITYYSARSRRRPGFERSTLLVFAGIIAVAAAFQAFICIV